jgi:amino acid permease
VTEERPALRPVLGRWQLLGLGIGTIIGSGIFVIPGPAAALFAGPAIILSFVFAALGCALAGLCYAELSAMFPAAGSAYSRHTSKYRRSVGRLARRVHCAALGVRLPPSRMKASGLKGSCRVT